jgi:Domain of unknown function (DUF1906)
MTALILDTAEDITRHLPAIKAAGAKTIIGYMNSLNPNGGKCWTPERVKAVAAAGLRVGLVHEGWGGVGGKGISAADGKRDGDYCRERAAELGAPNGACVYFACDNDFTPAQVASQVLPYFRAVRASFADRFYRTGVYGSGLVCAAVFHNGLVDLTWEAQSKGWAGFKDFMAKANMVQGASTHVDGVDVDPDVAQGDIGDYVPFASAPVFPQVDTAPRSIWERLFGRAA